MWCRGEMSTDISPKVYEALKQLVSEDESNFDVIVHNPNKKGEGFLGEMLFVTLRNKKSHRDLNVIVKQAFKVDSIRNSLPIRNIFLNEIYFYRRIWPELNKFQQSIPPAHQFQKVPKYLSSVSEEHFESIVMENLKFQNFEMHDKKKPLSKEQFELIMKEYGKFHGLSFAYKASFPEEYVELVKPLKDTFKSLTEMDFFQRGVEYIYEIAMEALQPGVDDPVIEKLEPYLQNSTRIFLESLECETEYSIITHGDGWSNNMMFKYNDLGRVTDVRFFDFQLFRVASPCCELSYCIYSGASKEVLQNLDHYFQIYRDGLSQTLSELGCDPEKVYPQQEMMKDWKRYCKLGITMGLLIWKLKFTYDEDMRDHTDLRSDQRDQLFKSAYDEKAFKTVSRDLLLHLYENDFL